jgi:hypothetical protein
MFSLIGLECPLLMQWTAPATGIAMCQNLVVIEERLESAFGYKQTSSHPKSMSALPPTPDIPGKAGNVAW